MGRKPIGATAMTGAERQRRYYLKHPPAPKPDKDATIRALEARVQALQTELIGDAALTARIRDLETKLAAKPAPVPPAPKPAKAPSDWAEDPRTKGLQTQVQNLRREKRATKEWYNGEIRAAEEKHKKIPSATVADIMFALHPDQRPDGLPPKFVEHLNGALLGMTGWLSSRKRH